MSKIQAVLSRIRADLGNVDRLVYILRASGGVDGQQLANALALDFDSTPEPFSFDPTDLASLPQQELLDGAKQLGEELTDENKRKLAAHVLALANGLDPDAVVGVESHVPTLTENVDTVPST